MERKFRCTRTCCTYLSQQHSTYMYTLIGLIDNVRNKIINQFSYQHYFPALASFLVLFQYRRKRIWLNCSVWLNRELCQVKFKILYTTQQRNRLTNSRPDLLWPLLSVESWGGAAVRIFRMEVALSLAGFRQVTDVGSRIAEYAKRRWPRWRPALSHLMTRVKTHRSLTGNAPSMKGKPYNQPTASDSTGNTELNSTLVLRFVSMYCTFIPRWGLVSKKNGWNTAM